MKGDTIMRVSVGAVLKEKAESKKSMNFGKMWAPGSTGVVLYPFYKNEDGVFEPLIAVQKGHIVSDMKELGLNATFIPTLSEFDSEGNIIGSGDVAYQFSRIAPCFVAGQKEAEMDGIRKKDGIDETMRQTLFKKVEDKYSRDNMKGVKPIISPLTFYISTECVYIPMQNGQPEVKAARLVAQKLSDARIGKLMALAADEKFQPTQLPGTDIYVLEVQYSWPAGDKGEAGRTDPQGLVPEYRLEAKFPNEYKSLMSIINTLPRESETIARRNYSYTKISEARVRQALRSYAVMKTEYLDALNPVTDEEMITRIEKNASIINELQLTPAIHNTDLLDKISAALELQSVHEQAVPSASEDEEYVRVSEAPSVSDLLEQEHIGDDDDIASMVDMGE